jgi:hypothetical protein
VSGRVPGHGVALPDLVDRDGRANAEGLISRTRTDPAATKPAVTDEWTVLAAPRPVAVRLFTG